MFLFEQMFNNAIAGIDGAGLMSTILIVAYGILLASLLFSVYEAWTRGGDVRSIGIAGAKYLVIGLLLVDDGTVYRTVFQSVIGAFNQMAQTMAGPGDVFRTWFAELRNAAASPTLLNLVTGLGAGLISALLLLIAMTIYPVAYGVFTVLYCLFGTILYVVGPLVLALMPSTGLGTLAKRYATNFVIFASWGLIYGIMCRLMLALNVNSMAAITGAGSFMGLMTSATSEVLLASVSILFSVCIMLIPFLAKRIVEGDLGGSMFAVLGATAALTQAMTGLATGSGDGWGRVSAGGGSGGGKGASGGASAGAGGARSPQGPPEATSGGSGGAGSGGRAPGGPGGGRSMGDHRPMSLPHAVGWLAGASAAMVARAGGEAIRSVRGSGGGSAEAPQAQSPTPPESSSNAADEWV